MIIGYSGKSSFLFSFFYRKRQIYAPFPLLKPVYMPVYFTRSYINCFQNKILLNIKLEINVDV